MFVFVATNARIWNCSMCLPELGAGYAGGHRPEVLSCFEVQTLAQVDTHSKARLVDIEEVTQPSTKQSDHRRICVGELHETVTLSSFARVECGSCHQKLSLRHCSDALSPLTIHLLDLAQPRLACGVRTAMWAAEAERRG